MSAVQIILVSSPTPREYAPFRILQRVATCSSSPHPHFQSERKEKRRLLSPLSVQFKFSSKCLFAYRLSPSSSSSLSPLHLFVIFMSQEQRRYSPSPGWNAVSEIPSPPPITSSARTRSCLTSPCLADL
jgi:hypothetical protein